MQVVIDIDEYEYKRVKELVSSGLFDYEGITPHLFKSVANGTPLPKGHGDLTDKNFIINGMEKEYKNSLSESFAKLFVEFMAYIDDAPTIIEAD